MNAAEEAIRAEIESCGSISFARFMELALYSEPGGYYAQCGRVGKSGDFFTSVSVGSCFGDLLARQFAECWETLGKPAPFAIIEQGANDGRLAADVLRALRTNHPDCFQAAAYQIIEPLHEPRSRQEETLREFGEKASWNSRNQNVGVFFCNELLDAFPVHLLAWDGAQWRERHVAVSEAGAFCWKDAPLSDPTLCAETERLFAAKNFSANYVTEICPGIEPWLASASALLSKGWLFIIDYGLERDRYYEPERTEGTLRGYRSHHRADNPLEAIGETDLTTHVDWTRVIEAAQSLNLETRSLATQSQFLTVLATPVLKSIESSGPPSGATARWLRQFQTLTHPGQMGAKFQTLVLEKEVRLQGP